MAAAAELGVRSPFRETGLTKAEIRALARHAGLPNWDKPAQPCLASRIPAGSTVTAAKLEQIERAERAIRDLGFAVVRVRHHGELARVEVACEDLDRLLRSPQREQILTLVRAAGFRLVTIDLEGYRSGNVSTLPPTP